MVRGASEMGDGGFKMSSKAWPEARLLIFLTSISVKVKLKYLIQMVYQ